MPLALIMHPNNVPQTQPSSSSHIFFEGFSRTVATGSSGSSSGTYSPMPEYRPLNPLGVFPSMWMTFV